MPKIKQVFFAYGIDEVICAEITIALHGKRMLCLNLWLTDMHNTNLQQ